jgi:hypothetical protein
MKLLSFVSWNPLFDRIQQLLFTFSSSNPHFRPRLISPAKNNIANFVWPPPRLVSSSKKLLKTLEDLLSEEREY